MMGVIRGKIGGASSIHVKVGTSGGISGKIKTPDSVSKKEIRFANHYEFPAIGNSECLYIAVDENATYRYDDEDRAYYCVGRDYKQIQAIQIKLKE